MRVSRTMQDYDRNRNCSTEDGQSPIGPDVRSIYDSFTVEEKEEFLKLMNITSIDDYLLDPVERFFEFRLHRLLRCVLPPIVFIVGIIGNSLSFVILSQRAMRLVSTYAYLAVLTFADTMVLTVGLLRIWFAELTGWDLRVWSQWSCKLTNVVGTTASDYSGWLIVAVTTERFIAVCYPLRAPVVCSRRRAYVIMVALLAFLLLFNAHLFWTSELIHVDDCGRVKVKAHCESSPDFRFLGEEVWPWLDAFVYSFVPFVVILVLNALIVRRVVMSRRQRDAQLCHGTTSSSAGGAGGGERSARMSVMLVTISFAFLVMTLPMNVTVIVNNSVDFRPHGRARMKLGRTVTELLMYVNHSMNFFLYCATGQKFRRELCAIFCAGAGAGAGGGRQRHVMEQKTMTSHHSENATTRLSARGGCGKHRI